MDFDLKEAMEYYRRQGAPGDQAALINLLKELGGQSGGLISRSELGQISEFYSVKENLLIALLKRVKSLRLSDCHSLEICGGPNCPKKADLYSFAVKRFSAMGSKLKITQTGCMHMCAKGPNIRFDGRVYNGADEALIEKLLQGI